MTSHPSIVLGITGGIACGKSEVGRILAQEGVHVLDADLLAHQVMKKNGPVWAGIVDRFGTGVLAEDGEIDRCRLGAVVFRDPRSREALNRLVHPAVLEAIDRWVERRRSLREDAAVLIPLLFEVGAEEGWDAIVCVTAGEARVFERLEQRGLSRDEAARRIAAQMPLDEKAKKSDFIIENSGSLETLKQKALDLLGSLRDERNKHE